MKIVNVIGYEGLYAVTDKGDVYSLKRGHIIKPSANKYGYLCVGLSDGHGKKKRKPIHQLVYYSFNGDKVDRSLVVDHIDGNILNNNLSNLRLLSNRDNIWRLKKGGYGRGVRYLKHIDKYGSEIHIDKERFFLGVFGTQKEAAKAYDMARNRWEEYGEKPMHDGKKICFMCGRVLSEDNFYIKRGRLTPYCKECYCKVESDRRNKG